MTLRKHSDTQTLLPVLRGKAAGMLTVTVAGTGLAVALAGCTGTPAPTPAGKTAVSQPSIPPAAPSAARSAAPSAARSVTPAAGAVAKPGAGTGTGSRPGTPSAQASASPALATGSQGGTAPPANGLYIDAPNDEPHYVLSLALNGSEGIKGSVNFVYSYSRVDFVGRYTGALSGNGGFTMNFGDGKVLTGSYEDGNLYLADCTPVLPLAAKPGGCTFAYHGYAGG